MHLLHVVVKLLQLLEGRLARASVTTVRAMSTGVCVSLELYFEDELFPVFTVSLYLLDKTCVNRKTHRTRPRGRRQCGP